MLRPLVLTPTKSCGCIDYSLLCCISIKTAIVPKRKIVAEIKHMPSLISEGELQMVWPKQLKFHEVLVSISCKGFTAFSIM